MFKIHFVNMKPKKIDIYQPHMAENLLGRKPHSTFYYSKDPCLSALLSTYYLLSIQVILTKYIRFFRLSFILFYLRLRPNLGVISPLFAARKCPCVTCSGDMHVPRDGWRKKGGYISRKRGSFKN